MLEIFLKHYVCVCARLCALSCVWLCVTPWTVVRQASLSMGFSRQEYWSRLPFPPPGDLPDPGIEPRTPALQADSFTIWATREAHGARLPGFSSKLWHRPAGCPWTSPKNSPRASVFPSVKLVFNSGTPHVLTLSCWTLYNPRDCSPPGSSVLGVSQARILERVAISSSRGSSRSRDQTCNSCISCIGRQILYHCTTREAQNTT